MGLGYGLLQVKAKVLILRPQNITARNEHIITMRNQRIGGMIADRRSQAPLDPVTLDSIARLLGHRQSDAWISGTVLDAPVTDL